MRPEPAQIETFLELVREKASGTGFSVDPPATATGGWFIDFQVGDATLTVEWRESFGFGFHGTGPGTYGERPAEFFTSPDLAARRVAQLAGRAPVPTARGIVLGDLRDLLGLTQTEMAGRLGVNQAAVSKFERRSDQKLGTLADYVRALGGTLEVRARFADCDLPVGTPLPPNPEEQAR